MAWLVTAVMRHAGAKVDEAEIYRDMMANEDGARALYIEVVAALSPAPAEKKDGAPGE